MDARSALIESWAHLSRTLPSGLMNHPTAREVTTLVYRIISDEINDVRTWDDVRDLTTSVLDEVWAPSLPKEVYVHVVQVYETWVNQAQKLAPTYTNPPPYV
jgi:hypothetical protein